MVWVRGDCPGKGRRIAIKIAVNSVIGARGYLGSELESAWELVLAWELV